MDSFLDDFDTRSNGVWTIFWIVSTVVAALFGLVSWFFLGLVSALGIGFGVFCLITFITLFCAWTQVPEKDEWVIEVLGKYSETWKAGLHFLFPYGFMKVKAEVYMGEQEIQLFMNDEVNEGFGKGHLDFKDGSSPVEADLFFKIVDAYMAVYGISDLFQALGDKADAAIRAYLGQYTIEQANELKARLDLFHILNGETADKDMKLPQPPVGWHKSQTLLWGELRENWGVDIMSIVIPDIVLPEDIMAARNQVIVEERAAEAAKHQKAAQITRAEGQKEELRNIGEGYAAQIQQLVAEGMTPAEARAYIQERLKWENVGDKTVIIESGGGLTGLGMQFAAGMNAMNQQGNPPSEGGNQ